MQMQAMLVVKLISSPEGISERHFVVMVERKTKTTYYLAENCEVSKVAVADVRKPIFSQWYMQNRDMTSPFWQFEAVMYVPFYKDKKPELADILQRLKLHILREFRKQTTSLKTAYKQISNF